MRELAKVKPDPKAYILYDSIYTTFRKRQRCIGMENKHISDYRVVGVEGGMATKGMGDDEEIFGMKERF